MKLKHKLAPIVFAGSMATLAVVTAGVTLTSCSGDTQSGPTTITYSGQKEFGITSSTYTMEFTLDKELPQYWSLTCGYHGGVSGTMIAGPKSSGITVSGKKVTVACEASKTIGSLTPGDYCSYGLTITCRNDNVKQMWAINIDGFKVTYQGA